MASIMENASIESAAAIVSHPYYPLEIEIASYLANEWTVHTLLTVFFGGCAVLFFCTRAFVAKRYPDLPSSEKAAIWWLVLCYFSLNHTRMGESQELFGQLWKEYALSDSRYLTSDPFVLCMETVTAIIVTVGQIYGLVLYYATHTFDFYYKEVIYSRPEFLYFWFYYFFMNFLWMIFPGMLLVDSVRTIAKAFTALEEINGTKGKDRDTKKLQ
ncbi:hypothetical protein CJF32_00001681 [Rutstroemia sp. NJR-2017a WRK4]|nr:hypothetical protein CJF32_00001681 [Rutstroemia sp. NJR-2017a WRK4]